MVNNGSWGTACGGLGPNEMATLREKMEEVRYMQLRAGPEVSFSDEDPGEDDQVLTEVARRMLCGERRIAAVQAAIEPKDPVVHPLAQHLTSSAGTSPHIVPYRPA